MSIDYIVALYLLLAQAVLCNNHRSWNTSWRTRTNTKTTYQTQNSYHYQYQYHHQYQYPKVNYNQNYQNNQNKQIYPNNQNNQIYQNNQGYEYTGLNWHNKFRRVHGAGGMSLDANLNQQARYCAQYYANRGTIDHSCNQKNGAGENLYMILGRVAVEGNDAVTRAVNSWYNEKSLYTNYNVQNGMSRATGHFTQLIWRGSQRLGVGVASVRGKTAVVVLYYPPGNYIGQFAQQVRPPTYG